MTKKVVTVYGMLFLFVFSFAFAFAMEARAGQPQPGSICCVYEWCHGPTIGIKGHLLFDMCFYDGISICDTIFVCADPN